MPPEPYIRLLSPHDKWLARSAGISQEHHQVGLLDCFMEVKMDGRFDFKEEDVVIVGNEPAGDGPSGLDEETTQILMEDRVATGG